MKKIASILVLTILIFNWGGFRFFSYYMEHRANQRLQERLDEGNYDDSRLLSVKIPEERLPYYTNSTQFEKINGEIEVNGVFYKYVKRRIHNDSLELLCIPNEQVMQLRNAKDDFFKLVNDLQHAGNNKNSHSGSSKSFSTDHYTIHDFFYINHLSFIVSRKQHPSADHLPVIYPVTEKQPPKQA